MLDYIARDQSDEFGKLCVYDFIAKVEVERKSAGRGNTQSETPLNDVLHTQSSQASAGHQRKRGRPLNARSNLKPFHPSHQDHQLRLRSEGHEWVPVPMGPSLPRRDKPERLEGYCRTMLILFKPGVR